MFKHHQRDNDVIKHASITPDSNHISSTEQAQCRVVQSLTKYPDRVSDRRRPQRLPISEHGGVGGQRCA